MSYSNATANKNTNNNFFRLETNNKSSDLWSVHCMDIQKCTNQAKNRQAKKRQTKTLPLDCSSITKTKSVLGNFEKVICFFLLKKISSLS